VHATTSTSATSATISIARRESLSGTSVTARAVHDRGSVAAGRSSIAGARSGTSASSRLAAAASSVDAATRVRFGASRPIIVERRALRDSSAAAEGAPNAAIARCGIHAPVRRGIPAMPSKLRGATPTISKGCPPSRAICPTIRGSAPNRVRHSR
jgi:hypothetical protein